MNKKTMLTTLLFTTVLSSGVVFASTADRDDLPFGSPATKTQLATLPKTPAIIADAQSKFSDDFFSPESAQFHRSMYVDGAKQERDAKRDELLKKTNAKAVQAAIEAKRRQVEEENAREIEALTLKMSNLSQALEVHRVSKGEAEQEAERLALKIRELESEKQAMTQRIALERASLEQQIEQDKEELERQKVLEKQILAEKAELEERIRQEQLEVERQKALGLQIERDKDELSKQSLAEKTALLDQIELEKAKKKQAMAASSQALEQMKKRLSDIARESQQYATERDELLLRTDLLETTEKGLRRQLELVHSHLDATTGGGTRVPVPSTPAATSSVAGGGGTSNPPPSSNSKPVSKLKTTSFRAAAGEKKDS
ncbi:MAG: hypothetical protein EBT45_01030 [Alphaproteobacteria bacterium]|nr:hypothetical protein [Alphaproteobacteria bacterium]